MHFDKVLKYTLKKVFVLNKLVKMQTLCKYFVLLLRRTEATLAVRSCIFNDSQTLGTDPAVYLHYFLRVTKQDFID